MKKKKKTINSNDKCRKVLKISFRIFAKIIFFSQSNGFPSHSAKMRPKFKPYIEIMHLSISKILNQFCNFNCLNWRVTFAKSVKAAVKGKNSVAIFLQLYTYFGE